MNEEKQEGRKNRGLGQLYLISIVLVGLGSLIDQTIRWSDHFQGFINGLFHWGFLAVAWCLYFIPWSLLICGLYRWQKWERFRTHWILAPAVLTFVVTIGGLVIHPPTPSSRFYRFTKTELPDNARNLQCHFSGGGIADYGDTYYFETTPEEVDRMIADMNLSEDENYGDKEFSDTPISRLAHGPDFSKWEGARQYRGWDERQHWFYYLITDASRTKVYMMVGCI